jgi:hypothetical protein
MAVKALEADCAVEAGVAGLVDFAHAAGDDGAEDFVGPSLSPVDSAMLSAKVQFNGPGGGQVLSRIRKFPSAESSRRVADQPGVIRAL